MERFRFIDSLRGIAVIMVIVSHCHPYFSHIENFHLNSFIDKFVYAGDKGVTLFYVLSAYTLCLSFSSKSRNEASPLKSFFIRRLFRIVPLYYFAILLFSLLRLNAPTIDSLLGNLFLVHGFNPNWINSTVPGGWSVGIEVIFYLMFPFIFSVINTKEKAISVTLLSLFLSKIVIGVLHKHPMIEDHLLWHVYVYENIISQLPVFLIGICLYYFINDTQSEARFKYTNVCICLLIILQIIVGGIVKDHYFFAIAFAFLTFNLAHKPFKFLDNKFIAHIGTISYSMYLMHLVVMNFLIKHNLMHFFENSVLDLIVRFLVVFSLSYLVSNFTYKYIEVPFQSLGKWLIKRNKLLLRF